MAIEIYGFSGLLGSGKNYVAEKIFYPLLPPKPTLFVAFADHFKLDCHIRHNIPYEDVFYRKTPHSRRLLQTVGQEARQEHGADIWIRTLAAWIRLHAERGIQRFIITDVRYPNEIEWVKSQGGKVFLIWAPQRHLDGLRQECQGDQALMDSISSHSSEQSNAPELFTAVINNDYQDERDCSDSEKNLPVRLQVMSAIWGNLPCVLRGTNALCAPQQPPSP